MHDFDDATAITMNTYQQIASVYADAHKFPDLSAFWRERLQRFAKAVRANPGYCVNSSLPVVDVGCGPGRDALFLAEMDLDVLPVALSVAVLDEARHCSEHQ